MAQYDNFAKTFSQSRKNMHWQDLDEIIDDIKVNNFKSVLDIGCGSGRFLDMCKKKNFTPHYLGVDASAGMIQEAQKNHPNADFVITPMQNISENIGGKFDAIIFIASFHHLETEKLRHQVLKNIKNFLAPNRKIYMTNWNLREQEKYQKSQTSDGEFQIKIGQFSRYYHGFTLQELESLFMQNDLKIEKNTRSENGYNLVSWVGN